MIVICQSHKEKIINLGGEQNKFCLSVNVFEAQFFIEFIYFSKINEHLECGQYTKECIVYIKTLSYHHTEKTVVETNKSRKTKQKKTRSSETG